MNDFIINKKMLKELLPPILIKSIRRFGLFNYGIYWRGNYTAWEDALVKSSGYDTGIILEKVKSALLKVKNGEAIYERDSVLFDDIEYSWPLLSGLLWVYAQENRLNLIDFGGSLGSTYFQNRKFINPLKEVRWNIIEQKKFVDAGIRHFQDDQLKFYCDIDSCIRQTNPNCILLSSVLPYIENPHGLVSKLMDYNFKFIILDKMPFLEGKKDRLTVQNIPKNIYKASYPAWFFSEENFKASILKKYELVEEFKCPDVANIESVYKGMILKLK
jgi:putative methyltransferase (TIGR04325 family)